MYCNIVDIIHIIFFTWFHTRWNILSSSYKVWLLTDKILNCHIFCLNLMSREVTSDLYKANSPIRMTQLASTDLSITYLLEVFSNIV